MKATGAFVGGATGDRTRPSAARIGVDADRLAKDDPSPMVRLALASALPNLQPTVIWEVATALSAHAEDAADRFLPKMIWFGLASVVDTNFSRALAIAESTKLQPLADSIRWYASTTAAGTRRTRGFALSRAGRHGRSHVTHRVVCFARRVIAARAQPHGPTVRERAAKSSDAAVRADADQLSAVFGDSAVLTRMRQTLADTAAPVGARQTAFDLLKRTGDTAALPIFLKLLDEPRFRSAAIPLLAAPAMAPPRSAPATVSIALSDRPNHSHRGAEHSGGARPADAPGDGWRQDRQEAPHHALHPSDSQPQGHCLQSASRKVLGQV
jgi:hypothetical protein